TTPSYVQAVYVRLTGTALGSFGGDVTNVSGVASVNVAVTGDVVPPDNLGITRNGPNSSQLTDNNSQGPGGNGQLLLDVTLSTIQSAWTVNSLTFTASGTADEQTGISEIALFEDNPGAGNQGIYDPFVDLIATAGPGVSFNGPNGTYTATLANTNFAAATNRRFYLMIKLAGRATAGQTIKAELTAVTATPSVPTGIMTGVPTNAANDAFEINDALAVLSLNGPVAYQTVNNDAQGPNGDGVVICDFRISPKNDSWTVSSVTFTESGTIDAQADISFLGLYIDNGNGIWDGPTTDLPATATTGVNFNAADGIYTAGLNAAASIFTVNQVKRFFLVARLAGSASTGETMRVSITGVVQTSPTGGSMIGVPTGNTSALVIDQPTLTVNAGPNNPDVIPRLKAAAGFSEAIGQIRLSASNSDFVVSGLVLHTAGNGDWLNNLDSATGVQVYRDSNSNGQFDAGDIKLFEGPGAMPIVNATFTSQQTVTMSSDVDLWVVLNVLPSAGGSPAEIFHASLETAADVVTTTTPGTVKIGTLAPESGTLRVIDFSVTEFTPTVGLFAGGASIKIEGTGFALPVTLTIGGVVCPGTPIVDATGTLITGLTVPAGTGTALPILLTTNGLPAQQLTDTFRYSSVLPTTGGDSGSSSDGGGCIAGAGTPMLALLAPAMLGALALRRRRK
ncbi:MAG TPA: IPT/TIG domain-containing protein, partial [Polyangiaceae bacterium]|nr:IPT/TIG domain-containing protein [Polyangiaceae bacterium]